MKMQGKKKERIFEQIKKVRGNILIMEDLNDPVGNKMLE